MMSSVHHRTRTGMQAGLVCAVIFLLAGFCFGEPAISLSPTEGPPTTSLKVSGSGFAPHAKIDLYFDTKDEALAVANAKGTFSGVEISVPASALPGNHKIRAVERSDKASAHAAFLVRTNWSQFHRQNMERWNPYENVLNVNNAGNLQVKWNHVLGQMVNECVSTSSPAVDHGVVYVGTEDGMLYALKASNGNTLWSYQTAAGGANLSSPGIAKGIVYFGSIDGLVYAFNATNGAKLWTYPTGAEVDSSPTIVNGVVYIGSNDGYLYALNASTGHLLWKYATGGKVTDTPAVENGIVYFGSYDGFVYALHAGTGKKLWSYYVGGNYEIWSASPAVANGMVYVGAGDTDYVYALNAKTGQKIWGQYIGSGYIAVSSPALAYGVVYIGSGDGNLYALDASTGVILWTYNTGNVLHTSSAVANGVVYFGTNNWVFYAADAKTGALLWFHNAYYPVAGSPAIADGVAYVPDCGGNFYAFSLPKN